MSGIGSNKTLMTSRPERLPDSADKVRSFLNFNRNGVLSTHSRSQPGFPFGSITPYDIDSKGRLIIWVAKIAEHYRNLTADPHASLFVLEQGGLNDPQPFARATVLLRFEPAAAGENAAIETSFHRRFPAKYSHEMADSFIFLIGTPVKIRWIGGFGDIRWIDGADFQSAAPDEVSYHGWDICDHMNSDHNGALIELVQGQLAAAGSPSDPDSASAPPPAGPAAMISVDRTGFVIAIGSGGKKAFHQILFPEPVASPDEVRRSIIAMLQMIRQSRSRD